jgi:hypothetical protein
VARIDVDGGERVESRVKRVGEKERERKGEREKDGYDLTKRLHWGTCQNCT